MEIPKVISLSSTQGDHAGFMLLAPHDESSSGDCVFMLTPTSTTGIDSDMGLVVSELKVSGEHQFVATASASGITLVVRPIGFPEIELQLSHEFKGSVLTEFGGVTKCIGWAEPLRGSA